MLADDESRRAGSECILVAAQEGSRPRLRDRILDIEIVRKRIQALDAQHETFPINHRDHRIRGHACREKVVRPGKRLRQDSCDIIHVRDLTECGHSGQEEQEKLARGLLH